MNVANAMKDKTLTVRIRGESILRARIWLGCAFLWLGAWVIGCRIRFDERKPL